MKKEFENQPGVPHAPKRSLWEKVFIGAFCTLLAFTVGVCSFFAGYYVRENKMNEELRTLDWVITQIKKNYYEDFTSKEIIDAATGGIETLLDRYSAYYGEEEYRAVIHGQQGYKLGIGVVIGLTADGHAQASSVLMGSPAEESGIARGDVFLGVRLKVQPAVAFTQTPTYADFTAALDALPENTEIELLTESDGEQKIRALKKREYVQITTRYYGKNQIPTLPDSAAYIRFDTFTGNAAQEFAAAMQQFKEEGKTQLILDLRGNGGGQVSIARKVAAHLVKAEKGATPVLMLARYQKAEETFLIGESVYQDYGFTDIRVLCDGGSASASEVLLGAMLDYGSITLNDLYGVTTYGKGIMQTTFENVRGEDAIKLTTAKIYWPVSDTCIHGVGITPPNEHPLSLDGKTYTFDRDAALTAAISSLRG